MTTQRAQLPPEGDEDEAREVYARNPIRLPNYRLERIHVQQLNVDYVPPFGSGYARPLSQHRLSQLRREWEPLAVSPLTISRRPDNTLWVIDGNHRRVIAYEKGMSQLPAMVHSGLERAMEAHLYTLLGTVLGQTPWTRFQAKIVAGDETAADIIQIASKYGLEINGMRGYSDNVIQAVARCEWIYARGGAEALNWVLAFLTSAFNGERASLGELQLEGVFGFYLRYEDRIDRDEIARMLGAAGFNAWFDRSNSIWQRIDVGPRSNTYGLSIAEMVNDLWRKKGVPVKKLLPAWQASLGQFGSRYRDAPFSSHVNYYNRPAHDPAPQNLAAN